MTIMRKYGANAAIALAIVALNLLVVAQIGLAYGPFDWTQYAGQYGTYGSYGPFSTYVVQAYGQGVRVPHPSEACVSAPALFDPPEGKNFTARNTVLRWRSDRALKPEEVYDALVWPEGGGEQTSLGTTRDTILPVDILTWKHAGVFGKFFWTVRVKGSDGRYISCETPPLSFVLSGVPGNPYNTQPGSQPPSCPSNRKC